MDCYLSWRIIPRLCVFNTTFIGLFDRSLLPMSLIQVELALKQATSKSRTSVSLYVPIRLYLNSIWEINKTSYVQKFFLFFGIMDRIRKGRDLPKKKVGSPSIQQKYSQIKLPQRSSALYFVEFRLSVHSYLTAFDSDDEDSMGPWRVFVHIGCPFEKKKWIHCNSHTQTRQS